MGNLTKVQKGKIVSQFIKENLHDAAIYLMLTLGKECKELGANITYSAQSKNVENPTVYRLHVSTVDSKDRMDDEYFIDVISFAPDNILEKMLEVGFRKYEHTTIEYAQIPDLKAIYLSVIDRYQKNGGSEKADFSIEDNKNDSVWIRIGDKLQLTLYKIAGEFWTDATERKEEQE
ncbi:MAG: hypothetical protein LIP01_02300 [Tannerellaceae bacterium]|nr:hypothetical protein [Tannerellaceae bacterium]